MGEMSKDILGEVVEEEIDLWSPEEQAKRCKGFDLSAVVVGNMVGYPYTKKIIKALFKDGSKVNGCDLREWEADPFGGHGYMYGAVVPPADLVRTFKDEAPRHNFRDDLDVCFEVRWDKRKFNQVSLYRKTGGRGRKPLKKLKSVSLKSLDTSDYPQVRYYKKDGEEVFIRIHQLVFALSRMVDLPAGDWHVDHGIERAKSYHNPRYLSLMSQGDNVRKAIKVKEWERQIVEEGLVPALGLDCTREESEQFMLISANSEEFSGIARKARADFAKLVEKKRNKKKQKQALTGGEE